MFELLEYVDASGRSPFTVWLDSLRDKMALARIQFRLRQVQAGNLGDVKPVGEGVSELRVHAGAGYRVYIGQHAKSVIILLCGGDKNTQAADIKRAKQFWQEWKDASK